MAYVVLRVSSIAVMLLGLLVLAGWARGSAILVSVVPGLKPMNPTTAVCFVLSGWSLWLLGRSRPGEPSRRRAQALAIAVAAVALLRLAELGLGWELDVDQLLFGKQLRLLPEPLNHMAANTAINFALLGVAIAIVDWKTRRGRHPSEGLALAAAVLTVFVLTGYSYAEPSFLGVGVYPMALNTALGLAVLCVGTLAIGFERGVVAVLRSRSAGGLSARRLLVAGVVLPWVLGWLRLHGELAGFYGTELGVSLFALATMLMFAGVAWWTARSLESMERKRRLAESALRESEARMAAILDNATAVIYLKDVDGRYLFVNRHFEETFRLARDAIVGKTDEDLFPAPYADAYRENDREVLAKRAPLEFEESAQKGDEIRTYVSLKFPLLHREGVPYALCGISTDITLRKRMQETLNERTAQAEAANAELEAFSYSVSHDLRAPLRAIEGYGRILVDDHASRLNQEGHRVLGVIRDNARHMGKLIDDLLALSRVGRKEIERAPIDMSALAQSIASDVAARDSAHPVRLSIAPLPPAQGDVGLVRQVLINLIHNAWKFTRGSENPAVEIGAVPNGEMVTYFVRDNGVGFENKYVAKLFGVFQRLHRAEEFEGTGVGLAIVERIVRRHGGQVSAEGELGRGATFRFSLPAAEGEKIDVGSRSGDPLGGGQSG